jgi:heme/copper-type cytochrome/quinol oxidase subunit 3
MASEATTKKHPYHMVDPSPWPAVGTLAAFLMAAGGIFFMHSERQFLHLLPFLAGVAVLFYTFYGWWRDVIHESDVHHNAVVRHGLRMGMVLFIASEVMFFFAFFWAFFNSSMPALSFAAQPKWPPPGTVPLETWTIPFLNTLILLSSGATVTYAHHAVRLNLKRELIVGLALTVALGFTFLGFQAYEYIHAEFKLSGGIFGSTFYLATGFHGFHVFIGACFLSVCLYRALNDHFRPDAHVGFEAAAWYWHFVDVVWLFLFTWVYWWSTFGYVPGA